MAKEHTRFRKIPTRRGDYIVSWEPQHVDFLFRSEKLTPADLSLVNASQARGLIRDLFLLGAQQNAIGTERPAHQTSLISRFARGLLGIYSPSSPGLSK